jgi:hypothetical protein
MKMVAVACRATTALMLCASSQALFGQDTKTTTKTEHKAERARREDRAIEGRHKMLDAPESPVAQPFNDQTWMLRADMHYTVGRSGVTLTVPKGFVTDFASIPRPFWLLLPPTGTYSRAAVIHDWLYWVQLCTREQSDKLLLIAMEESDVSPATRATVYTAVRDFGGAAWRGNADERRQGYIRILVPPFDVIAGNTTWSSYREKLRREHAPESPGPADAAFCHLGDSHNIT